MGGRLSIYIVPFLMVLIEWALRSAFSVDTLTFVGPTIASVGVGFLLPLTRAEKKRHPSIATEVYEEAASFGYELRLRSESRFIDLCWPIIFVSLGIWVWTLYESIRFPKTTLGSPFNLFGWAIGPFPVYDYIGMISYSIGVVMTEIRERIGERVGDTVWARLLRRSS